METTSQVPRRRGNKREEVGVHSCGQRQQSQADSEGSHVGAVRAIHGQGFQRDGTGLVSGHLHC